MSVALLADENIPMPVVRALRESGFDVLSASESMPRTPDRELLRRARLEQRWLLSFDHDFGELIFARGEPAPTCVVLLRLNATSPLELAGRVAALMHDQKQFVGQFVVVDNDKIRLRPLPK